MEYKEEIEYYLERFEHLCHQAKYYLFEWIIDEDQRESFINAVVNYDILDCYKMTPIEQIFYICYYKNTYEFFHFDFYDDVYLIHSDYPFYAMLWEELRPQEEVIINNKKYIIDFILDFSRKSINSNDYLYPGLNDLKYAVELDGFEYHSSKQQVNHDYEREQDLLAAGYKVIRFTGSQIYKDPFECVDKFFKIVKKDIGDRLRKED